MVDGNTRLLETTSSKSVLESITKRQKKWEAEGYLRQSNAALSRAIVAKMRERKARTSLKITKAKDNPDRCRNTKLLAKEGAQGRQATEVLSTVDPKWAVPGASIGAMSQKLAYYAIRKKKKALTKPREVTTTNLALIIEGVKEAFEADITQADVWNSFRSKHISGLCSQFLWKTTHDLFMVGNRWRRKGMPEEYEDRAVCAVCQNTESMDHILFRCEAPGQAEVWGELKTLWALTGIPWREPNWGPALGAGCAVFKTEKGVRQTHTEALWTILWSEAVHLIWKLRCERVIRREGNPHDKQEVINAWRATIERRLTLDRRTAVLAKGKKDLKQGNVAAIWAPIIDGYKDLPEGWVGNSGVLVGIKRGQG
ncbi:hypothetical protein BD311DRAFT_667103 [Dichomitus squalens]|uniref:Uncharacterized protein n=1 Tax=Dichomitus squalens TaxID=114155 RepID=A0A4Q9MGN7_9APHY|nr:hypothetical protein BD311DRAFT_667103 [Dichomitus squalens]